MAIEKIIVLQSEISLRSSLENYLRRNRYDVASASTIDMARGYLNKDSFDLIFLDPKLSDGDGLDFLKEIQARPQKILAVITAGSGSVESAVECIKNGAFDYLIRPFSEDQVAVTLRKAEEFVRLIRVTRLLSQESNESEHSLLGQSREMENLKQLIHKVAKTSATVLIQGESGTGKEAIARAIYRESSRACAPFIRVNCAAIPENLIESEFFGHEKGSFTGALAKREGRFELAHGGTILLDEISEISPALQAKLLRVLQEREFERIGGNRTIKVDVRVIATTNRNLEESVERKEFRQDLFYRLNVVRIHIPPLRERLDDVPLLVNYFLEKIAREQQRKPKSVAANAIKALEKYHWPGNVRELENAIRRALVMAKSGAILPGDLPPEISGQGGGAAPLPAVAGKAAATDAAALARQLFQWAKRDPKLKVIPAVERELIIQALKETSDNQVHAAKLLGITRATLRKRIEKFGIQRELNVK